MLDRKADQFKREYQYMKTLQVTAVTGFGVKVIQSSLIRRVRAVVAQGFHKPCVSSSILLPATQIVFFMEEKKMRVLYASTIRSIVDGANDLNIKRQDIVALHKEEDQFFLIYYGKERV